MRQELNRSLDALEQRDGNNVRPWHQILVDVGQSEGDAIAGFEAGHGSVAGDNLILRQMVDAPRCAA
jgi:hypothetical protein